MGLFGRTLGVLLAGVSLLGIGSAFQPQAQAGLVTQLAQSLQLPTVSIKQLPPEARTTIQLINRGGPFPYKKDGTIFGNRERRLPQKPGGYYKEYTVPTPGLRSRGARRLVSGQGGELYYTGDHYRSFVRVVR